MVFHRWTVQIRRMKVAEIWDKPSSNLSYAKVLSIAAGFTDVAHDSFVANAKATYIDEDGDEVNISSDDELKDAFLQAIAMLPVRKPFLINVTAPKAKVAVPTTNNKAAADSAEESGTRQEGGHCIDGQISHCDGMPCEERSQDHSKRF